MDERSSAVFSKTREGTKCLWPEESAARLLLASDPLGDARMFSVLIYSVVVFFVFLHGLNHRQESTCAISSVPFAYTAGCWHSFSFTLLVTLC